VFVKNELEKQLCDRYPLIFAERGLSTQQSCMGRGLACNDGWFDLIDTLCERLQFSTDHNHAPQVVATQVKEKFGQLCIYLRPGASDQQRGMVAMAQAMSARLCEQCGKPGQTLVHGFWHLTRCSEHAPEGAITIEAFLVQRKVPGIAP
jgi:hypothetical protein